MDRHFAGRTIKQWDRLPRKVLCSLFLMVTQQNKTLSNFVWSYSWNCFEHGAGIEISWHLFKLELSYDPLIFFKFNSNSKVYCHDVFCQGSNGLISLWSWVESEVGHDDPCGSFPTEDILWFYDLLFFFCLLLFIYYYYYFCTRLHSYACYLKTQSSVSISIHFLL